MGRVALMMLMFPPSLVPVRKPHISVFYLSVSPCQEPFPGDVSPERSSRSGGLPRVRPRYHHENTRKTEQGLSSGDRRKIDYCPHDRAVGPERRAERSVSD